MKNRAVNICLGITTLIAVFLLADIIVLITRMAIPWVKADMANSRIDRTVSVVPDEETAVELAYILVDENIGWRYAEDLEEFKASYQPHVTFDKRRNEWDIFWSLETEAGGYVLDHGMTVRIRKDNGKVTCLTMGGTTDDFVWFYENHKDLLE